MRERKKHLIGGGGGVGEGGGRGGGWLLITKKHALKQLTGIHSSTQSKTEYNLNRPIT